MRVTNGMIRNTTLNGLYNNMNALNKTYAQMATGKKIQTVSDDPIIAGRALKLTTTVLETSQYQSNVEEAKSWMEVTEAALNNMTSILTTIRTKCVQGSNGDLGLEERENIKTDIEQLWKQLQDEANVTYADRYVFSGYKTNQPLMKDGEVNTEVDGKINGHEINYEIGVNSTITVNTEGMDKLMNEMKACFEGIFKAVDDDTKTTEDLHNMFTEKLDEIDNIMKQVSEKNSDLGSRMSRINYTADRLVNQKLTFSNLLSETEDIDIEEVYTDFNVQYATYQSALQATSKIITNTLADYL